MVLIKCVQNNPSLSKASQYRLPLGSFSWHTFSFWVLLSNVLQCLCSSEDAFYKFRKNMGDFIFRSISFFKQHWLSGCVLQQNEGENVHQQYSCFTAQQHHNINDLLGLPHIEIPGWPAVDMLIITSPKCVNGSHTKSQTHAVIWACVPPPPSHPHTCTHSLCTPIITIIAHTS